MIDSMSVTEAKLLPISNTVEINGLLRVGNIPVLVAIGLMVVVSTPIVVTVGGDQGFICGLRRY